MTPLERRYLRRRICGWCGASLTAESCEAMSDLFGERCDMDAKRALALKDYNPRGPRPK